MIVFAKLRWRTSFLALEDTVEVAQVVETALKGNLRNAPAGVYQQSGGIAQTDVDDVFGEIAPCMVCEEATEGTWTHAGNVRQLRQANLVLIVLVDEVFHFQYPPAVVLDGDFGKT